MAFDHDFYVLQSYLLLISRFPIPSFYGETLYFFSRSFLVISQNLQKFPARENLLFYSNLLCTIVLASTAVYPISISRIFMVDI